MLNPKNKALNAIKTGIKKVGRAIVEPERNRKKMLDTQMKEYQRRQDSGADTIKDSDQY